MAGLASGTPRPINNSYFGMAYNPNMATNTMVGNTRTAGQQPNGTVTYSPQNMYNASLPQSASDYDSIMQGYRDILARAQNPGNNTQQIRNTLTADLNKGPVTAKKVSYDPSQDDANALNTLRSYSQNGGYTDEDIRSLRERGVSPIRSVYANANRNLNRQRSLQGGYAPGMAAATTRMAREMAQQLADRVTDVNASIANNQAAGRREMTGKYADTSALHSGRRLAVDTGNADRELEATRTNAGTRTSILNNLTTLEGLDRQPLRDALSALEGMRGLYGTTPAQPALYGQQAFNATRNVQDQQQQGFNNQVTAQNLLRRTYGGGLRA